MSVRVGVNGFGRIGRLVIRAALREGADIDFVAINDLTDARTLGHLFKYDSVHGVFPGTVEVEENALVIDGDRMQVTSETDPANLPWGELGVDVVVESTGRFTDRASAAKHLEAGAQKVIISAPAKDPDVTVCLGVNDDELRQGAPRRRLQRQLHDQLPGADGQGAGRQLRHRAAAS